MGEVVGEAVHVPAVRSPNAMPGAGQFGQQGLQRQIDVDHLMGREVLADRLDRVRVHAQEVPHVLAERREL